MAGQQLLVTPISPDGLFVRSGPGTDHEALASVFMDEALEVREEREQGKAKIGRTGAWLHIRTSRNVEGYVAAEFVRRAYVTPPGGAPLVPGEARDVNPRHQSMTTVSIHPIPLAEQVNLLQNAVFDADTYEQVRDGSTHIPESWVGWWEQPAVNDCYNFKPNFGRLTREQAPNRVHAGSHVAFYYSSWASHHAGYYQTVDVEAGTVYRFSIWGHGWASAGEPVSTSTTKLWVGIDPTGGSDPLAASLVWGPAVVAMDVPYELVVEARALGDKLTVFTRSRPDWCMEHNNVFWDDARLVAVAREVGVEVESPDARLLVATERLSVEDSTLLDIPLILVTTELDGLTIRSGPGTGHERLTAIGRHDRVRAVDPAEARTKLGKQAAWIELELADGVRGWAAAWFLQEAPATAEFPFGHALPGLHGPADPAAWAWTDEIFGIIEASGVRAVKVLCAGDIGGEQIRRLEDLGIEFIMARLFAKFGEPKSPEEFVDEIQGATDRLYGAGVRWFEVHNEPNLHHKDGPEGMWVMWQNGQQFAGFLLKLLDLLRQRYPEARFGWPGLSPGLDFSSNGKPLRYASARFEEEAASAMMACDFICMHTYWGADGSPYTRALADLNDYAERFPDKIIIASEFSNASQHVDKRDKGKEYGDFYIKAQQTLPQNVGALFSYVLSASGGYTAETWQDSPISELVARALRR